MSSSGSKLVFLKLGGSLITDKVRQEAPRLEVLQRVAGEIAAALREARGLKLVLGHGSGSYGHFAAERYGVHRGHLADWRGYAETSAAAARLDRLVVDACLETGLAVVALQPSASARSHAGMLHDMATWPVEQLLARGLTPVVYGDVALDDVQGCAIVSTEQIFACLSRALPPDRILLAGEVDGVLTADPERDPAAQIIPCLTPSRWRAMEARLGGSRGVDVTGGMRSKVRQMMELVEARPALRVTILSGLRPGNIGRALLGEGVGTVLSAEEPCQPATSAL
jgi:isopentenyl phosphate kinase